MMQSKFLKPQPQPIFYLKCMKGKNGENEELCYITTDTTLPKLLKFIEECGTDRRYTSAMIVPGLSEHHITLVFLGTLTGDYCINTPENFNIILNLLLMFTNLHDYSFHFTEWMRLPGREFQILARVKFYNEAINAFIKALNAVGIAETGPCRTKPNDGSYCRETHVSCFADSQHHKAAQLCQIIEVLGNPFSLKWQLVAAVIARDNRNGNTCSWL